jgi:cyclic di-GMP phosphodiesterase
MPNINEIKIRLEGLQIGMYVSRTDRTWADLPIQLEGVVISSNEEIDMLNKYCNSVYIDTSKGRSASPMYWIVDSKTSEVHELREDLGKNEYTILRKENYNTVEPLSNEMVTAKNIYDKVEKQICQAFDNLEQGKLVDISDLKDAVSQTVDSILRNPTAFKLVMEMQRSDHYSYNRALATSVWCGQFGRHLGLEKESINELALGGLLLDIGKVKVPDELLKKRGGLTTDEIVMLRSHVDFSVQMLINHEDISHNVMRMVATHHERADGTGYPLGLLNKDIPIFGRIAGIVDSFDAMISKRPFSSVIFSAHEAIGNLYELRERLFQADLVEQFIQTVGLYPTGTLVELTSGEVAVVTAISGLKRLRPTVILILDENKQPYDEFNSIDLAKDKDKTIKWDLKYGDYGIKMDDLFL